MLVHITIAKGLKARSYMHNRWFVTLKSFYGPCIVIFNCAYLKGACTYCPTHVHSVREIILHIQLRLPIGRRARAFLPLPVSPPAPSPACRSLWQSSFCCQPPLPCSPPPPSSALTLLLLPRPMSMLSLSLSSQKGKKRQKGEKDAATEGGTRTKTSRTAHNCR